MSWLDRFRRWLDNTEARRRWDCCYEEPIEVHPALLRLIEAHEGNLAVAEAERILRAAREV